MQVASLGLLLSGALIMYKSCMLITNSESPIVVVLRCVMFVGVVFLLKKGVLVGVVSGACCRGKCQPVGVSAAFHVWQLLAIVGCQVTVRCLCPGFHVDLYATTCI